MIYRLAALTLLKLQTAKLESDGKVGRTSGGGEALEIKVGIVRWKETFTLRHTREAYMKYSKESDFTGDEVGLLTDNFNISSKVWVVLPM